MVNGQLLFVALLNYYQAHSQKILLGRACEEKVDLLILQYSPGEVEEFIIVWCMLMRACIDFLKRAVYLLVLAKPTLLFMQIIL